MVYIKDSKGKFYFFNSKTGDYLCYFSPLSLLNKKYHKGVNEINTVVRHLGKQIYLLCLENLLVIINVTMNVYLAKHEAKLVRKFNSNNLYSRKLPKLHPEG